jgi:broad specificity phosphatase PhoE
MGLLTLVRHGQASFGEADYDQLSELGTRQCERLGQHFSESGRQFGHVMRGSLRRHVQSLLAIERGLGRPLPATEWPGLNEYDSVAVIRTVHTGELAKPRSPEEYRQHFRWLREGLLMWMQGRAQPAGMPTYATFAQGVSQALDQARLHGAQQVLIVSSGGPIATAVAQVLQAPPEASIELNLRIRNSALTEFHFTPKRHSLHSFNHLPHLHGAQYAGWETFT